MHYKTLESALAYIATFDSPTLFLMVGLPFSGKSYISKQIQTLLGIQRVSFDESWAQLSIDCDDLDWETVTQNNVDYCTEVLKNRQSVVYDTYSRDNWSRNRIKDGITKQEARFVIVYCKKNADSIRSRYHSNEDTQARHSIPLESLNNEIKFFVEPEAGSNNTSNHTITITL